MSTRFTTALIAMLLTVTGCAVNSTAPDFCSSYQIVPTLHCGSDIQQRNVDKNNALWMEKCQ